MPLTFPLAAAEFQDTLKITEVELYLNHPRQIDRTAGGLQLSASLGDSVWRGSFVLPPTNDRNQAARRDALISILDRPGSSFLVYPPEKTHPALDPDGSILGAATPFIDGLNLTDAGNMAIGGLPVGYVISSGDYIGWQYGSDPVRYALHRVVIGGTAGSSGRINGVDVVPFIQPGVVVDVTQVQLIRPAMRAVLDPDPDYGVHRPVVSSGARFSFVQTLV